MADVTGGPVVTNASPFAVPADLTALKDHFGDATKYTYATTAGLPASGNWIGRTAYVQEDGSVRVVTALPGTWTKVHEDTGWVTPTLLNSWVAHGGAYRVPMYRRINGVVYGRGMAKSGTVTPATVFYTLPVGFRPASQDIYAQWANGASNSVEVASSGNVVVGDQPAHAVKQSIVFTFPAEA